MNNQYSGRHPFFNALLINTLRKFITYLLLFIFILLFSYCSRNPEAINIGMVTKLKTTPEHILNIGPESHSFFENNLQLKNHQHFPGKIFLLFDTVYTSVVDHPPRNRYDDFMVKNALFLNERVSDKNLTSLFFLANDMYIYRTIIPEDKFDQAILVDIASRDSLKISEYFNQQRMKDLIIK